MGGWFLGALGTLRDSTGQKVRPAPFLCRGFVCQNEHVGWSRIIFRGGKRCKPFQGRPNDKRRNPKGGTQPTAGTRIEQSQKKNKKRGQVGKMAFPFSSYKLRSLIHVLTIPQPLLPRFHPPLPYDSSSPSLSSPSSSLHRESKNGVLLRFLSVCPWHRLGFWCQQPPGACSADFFFSPSRITSNRTGRSRRSFLQLNHSS